MAEYEGIIGLLITVVLPAICGMVVASRVRRHRWRPLFIGSTLCVLTLGCGIGASAFSNWASWYQMNETQIQKLQTSTLVHRERYNDHTDLLVIQLPDGTIEEMRMGRGDPFRAEPRDLVWIVVLSMLSAASFLGGAWALKRMQHARLRRKAGLE